ncbi:hypothetical protein [Kaistella jeonii]|uniref:Uncharacterized protein n=1 Tax=Kaistella jeonii TaxID=266749 RepID=A0A0C1FQK3_9FLAO|nr:hypothetical protein [Kaistella jeonii]KIA90144.1 hypothetical protein OA86_06030 [Kaistella jeonii]SFB77120.1 hypothetical protein SAMN05421876_10279 [Kaistella jeonii]VEI96427.1 Uncharacterised protein [Kaistella jeonii]
MQNLQDLQEKIFFESKNILDTLSKINSKEELLSKQDLFAEVADRIAFLRILEKNKESFQQTVEESDNQEINNNIIESGNEDYLSDSPLSEDVIEEEVIFTNEINEIDNSPDHPVHELRPEIEDPFIEYNNPELSTEEDSDFEEVSHDLEDFVVNGNFASDKEIPLVVEQEEADYAERISQKEKDFLDSEERRRKIVEFGKVETPHPVSTEAFSEEKITDSNPEKKFKLANIKGLKAVQNLFDDDPLENIEENSPEITTKTVDPGSLLKSNIPTDFMEAPKKQHEFKLDFNDKIAFTKLLFNGDETDLKNTIDRLNSYQKLEDARQYLSEVYYQKDWSKADEYAQRLWDLVESKFL